MHKFDYEQIHRALRAGNVAKFRGSSAYTGVAHEQAESIERQYIDGEIKLPEFASRIDAIRRTITHS